MIINWRQRKQQRAAGCGPAAFGGLSLLLLLSLVQSVALSVRCDQVAERQRAADLTTAASGSSSSLAEFTEAADAMTQTLMPPLSFVQRHRSPALELLLAEAAAKGTAADGSETGASGAADTAAIAGDLVKGELTPNGLGARLGHLFRGVVAPAHVYVKLIQRYINWFRQYKAFVNSIEDSELRQSFKDPMDVLKEEYARAEVELHKRRCSAPAASGAAAKTNQPDNYSQQQRPAEAAAAATTTAGDSVEGMAEGMEFVYETLAEAIDSLEQIVTRLRATDGTAQVALDTTGSRQSVVVDEQRVSEAMGRVRKSVLKSATSLLNNELYTIARIAALNAFATFVATKAAESDSAALAFVAPYVYMLASRHMSLKMAYWKTLELRAVIAILDRLNPMALLKCGLKRVTNKRGGISNSDSNTSQDEATMASNINQLNEATLLSAGSNLKQIMQRKRR